MSYCPWCHKDLGDRGSVPRHRRQCDFAPGTPWGTWSERFLAWTRRHERKQGEAYASVARILFHKLVPDSNQAGYVAEQHRLLRQDFMDARESERELTQMMDETPKSPLGLDGAERLRSLKLSARILEARLHEITGMLRYLEER